MKAAALSVLSVFLALAVVPGGVDAETAYDQDMGRFWSMTVGMDFAGEHAESIEWDFGDGTPVSNDWNVKHTYENTGVYYVKQTLTNSYNGGSTTVTVYKIEVMGYPTVTFETNGGSAIAPIQMQKANVPVDRPEDPVKDGSVFAGWYSDSALTEPYDWNQSVNSPVTVYAKWTSPAVVTHKVSFDVLGGSISVADSVVEDGRQFTLPSYIGVLEGKDFIGWILGSTQYLPGDKVSVTEDLRFCAVWKDKAVVPEEPGTNPDDSDKDPQGPGTDPEVQEPSVPDESEGDSPFDTEKVLKLVSVAVVSVAGVFVAVFIVRRLI